MKRLLFLLLLVFTTLKVNAQCDIQLVQKTDATCNGCSDGSIEVQVVKTPAPSPDPETCTNCDVTYADNTMDVNVPSGQTHCVTAADFTKGISISGGTLIVCGKITPSWLNFSGGRLIISGEANFTDLHLNAGNEIVVHGTLRANQIGISGTFTNHGTVTASTSISVYSGSTVSNKGDMTATGSFPISGTFTNTGNLDVGSLAFHATTTMGGSSICHNLTEINAPLTLQSGTLVQTTNIVVYHPVSGPSQGCAMISVSNNSTIGSTFSGNLSFCDANGLETVHTTNPASFYNCDCNTNDPGCTLTWNTGQTGTILQNVPAGTYTVTTSGCECSISEDFIISQPAVTSDATYAGLYKKLSGGYYVAADDKVYFIFREDYSVSSSAALPYRILDNNNAEVTASLVNSAVSLGDNRYMLGVSALALGYYILEVKNAKDEKWFLRFRVD